MIEQVLGDSAKDPGITSRGEIDEIQDESVPSVETEKEETEPHGSQPVEETSLLNITPAGTGGIRNLMFLLYLVSFYVRFLFLICSLEKSQE